MNESKVIIREQSEVIRELRDRLATHEDKASDAAVMVPIYVHLPHAVYQRLRERAEEQGQPAAELASLWLWRATREF